MKVCYVIDCMYNSGGMERVLSVCANALANTYDITIVTSFQQGRPDFFKLSTLICRHDLRIDESLPAFKKKNEYKKRLTTFLKEQYFDVVISLGGLDFSFLHSIRDGSIKFLWFHFVLDFNEQYLGINARISNRIKARLQTWKRIYFARRYDCVIALSETERNRWKRYVPNTIAIYNPITITPLHPSDCSAKAIVSVGRLDFQKGYDYLIDAWARVTQKHPDWHLDIYGEGALRNALQEQIDGLQLNNTITLFGRVPNIEEKYPLYSFYVMSSRAEGLGLVLLEAASCGLPLISYDCPSGPREIIQDGENGILIKQVGDVNKLADAINHLIEHSELRNQMGKNALRMVERFFSLEPIIQQWIVLFNSFTSSNKMRSI